MNKLILFTLNDCIHCIELKNSLNELNIKYNEIVVNDNNTIWNQIVKQTGYSSLPTLHVLIDGIKNGPIFVPERDFNSKEDCIEIIKKWI